jgi:glycosyltransferase involved in cell wall biosynthesis
MTSNQYPLFIKNGIATIHDIIFKYYLDAPWWTFKLKQRYLNFVIKNSLRRAGSVIAVSESTKKMLNDVYKTNNKIKNKIEVIYEGWEHLINEETNAEKEGLNNQFGSYLFYVGGTRKHKNIKRLLKAFNIAKAALPEYVNLVLSGNETYLDEEDKRTIASINEKSKRVILTGYVSKTKLDNLFLHADAFIFPSLCEGFGIPVLETFYFEKPLLCSNSTSLPEIAGDAALFFDPENVKDIANKIIFFYNHPEIVADLIKKGKERLLDFSWAKAANETITLYHNHFDK